MQKHKRICSVAGGTDGIAFKVPNFFIVGAARSGTTALYHYLRKHPDVYMSPIKETNYFATDIFPENFSEKYKKVMDPFFDLGEYLNQNEYAFKHVAYVRRWEDYIKLFKNARHEKAIGEASVSYLYSSCAAENIYRSFPDAKIIMILRNPAERAFSHYLMDNVQGLTTSNFLDTVKSDMSLEVKGWGISGLYVELGQYYEQLKRYLDYFPKRKIKVYIYEEFRNDFYRLIKDACNFLNVHDNLIPEIPEKINKAYMPRFKVLNRVMVDTGIKRVISALTPSPVKEYFKSFYYNRKSRPVLTREARMFLSGLYLEEIMRLSELLNKDLSLWIEPE